MKQIRKYSLLTLFLLAMVSIKSQPKLEFRELSRDTLINIAREIIDSAKCTTLISVDEQGKPHARAMSPFEPETNMAVWLGTSINSRKVKQIKNNPNVVVYYFESEGKSYVSLAGKAELVNDLALKKKYWKKGWDVFYPNPEKDYILIKVTPERMEVCSFKYKLFWDHETLMPQYIEFMNAE